MSKLSEGKGVEIPVYDWLGKIGWTPRTTAFDLDDDFAADAVFLWGARAPRMRD